MAPIHPFSSGDDRGGGSHDHKPSRLAGVLNQVIRRRGIAEQSAEQQWNELWKKIAGERIASRSRIRRVHRGRLEVVVNNGAILEELIGFRRDELLRAVQANPLGARVVSMKFVRGH